MRKFDTRLTSQARPSFLEQRDNPFTRVPLVPAHAIAIVTGKTMVKVVVSLAKGKKGNKPIIFRCCVNIVRRSAKHMAYGVNEEREVVNHGKSKADAQEKGT